MRNASLAFEILTRNPSLVHHYFLFFQTSIKALRVPYAEFIASLSVLQVTVDMN